MIRSKIFFVLMVVLLSLASCSEYQKVLKSPNPELKYTKSLEYYEDGEYLKALPLFEELLPLYKGTEKGQKLFFYYAYTNYHIDDLYQAAYMFRSYASTYSLSKDAQEALFMSAYCNYLDAPGPTLDQTPTKLALEELQIFVNTYPKSELVDSANALVDILNKKLEVKEFQNAMQYFKIQKYQSAIVALNNMITKYPDTEFLEEVKLTILESYYYLASNSVASKKKDRFTEGIEAYYDFIDNFAEGKFIEEAKLVYAKLVREQERFLTEN